MKKIKITKNIFKGAKYQIMVSSSGQPICVCKDSPCYADDCLCSLHFINRRDYEKALKKRKKPNKHKAND